MRTTIDLPDDLYRSLKARAALTGTTLRELIRGLIEQGLSQPRGDRPMPSGQRQPPPAVVPGRGIPIAAVSGAQVRRMEEEEDEAKHAGSAGR